MNFNDDFDDDFDDNEFRKEKNEELKRIKSLKIVQKAEEIIDLHFKICDLIETDKSPEGLILSEAKSQSYKQNHSLSVQRFMGLRQ
jgi:hypothetical protein